jgi:hypothetical protein
MSRNRGPNTEELNETPQLALCQLLGHKIRSAFHHALMLMEMPGENALLL